MLNPIQLAYVGDSVHDLLVRNQLVWEGAKVNSMHRQAIARVNAASQARALEKITPMLTEEEMEVVRRGRNAHAHHPPPKRANPAEYTQSTALEALFGFLFLTGENQRLKELYEAMNREEETCQEQS